MSQPRPAVLLALSANAVMWGAAYPAMKVVLGALPAPAALALRFALASLAVLPMAAGKLRHRGAVRFGVLIGSIMLAIYSLLAFGLTHLSASRCAFIMATTVVFVQLKEIWTRRRVVVYEALAASLSIAGVCLVTGWDDQPVSIYDAVVLLAAMLSAAGLVMVHRATAEPSMPADALTFYQLSTLATGAAAHWALTYGGTEPIRWSPAPLVALVFLALFPSALAQRLQMLYQRHASPSLAAMIYALKPLFAALLSMLILAERMRPLAWVGGGMMLVATFGAPLWQLRRAEPEAKVG